MTAYEMDCWRCINKVYENNSEYCKPYKETGHFPFTLEGHDKSTFVFRCPKEIKPNITLIKEDK